MGRQWLQKKRLINGLANGKTNNKLARDISLAARGGADPAMNSPGAKGWYANLCRATIDGTGSSSSL